MAVKGGCRPFVAELSKSLASADDARSSRRIKWQKR